MAEKGLCWTQIVDYTRQTVNGLEFLHSNHIKHMDIKPVNLVLTNLHSTGLYQVAKVADVDDPAVLHGRRTRPNDMLKPGTKKYYSPEMRAKTYG